MPRFTLADPLPTRTLAAASLLALFAAADAGAQQYAPVPGDRTPAGLEPVGLPDPSVSSPTPLPAPPGDADVPGLEEAPQFGTADVPGPPRPAVDSPPGTPFFAETEYGARPDLGLPGAPGYGVPHRLAPTNRYGVWYRPGSFHEPGREVYRPRPFRPRGNGGLFYRPCQPDRMDYARYTVRDLPSRYGPTYYPNYTDKTECLIRPVRAYDPPGPDHAEEPRRRTAGRTGADACNCPDCRAKRGR